MKRYINITGRIQIDGLISTGIGSPMLQDKSSNFSSDESFNPILDKPQVDYLSGHYCRPPAEI